MQIAQDRNDEILNKEGPKKPEDKVMRTVDRQI